MATQALRERREETVGEREDKIYLCNGGRAFLFGERVGFGLDGGPSLIEGLESHLSKIRSLY